MSFAFAVPKGLEPVASDDVREAIGMRGEYVALQGSGFVTFTADAVDAVPPPWKEVASSVTRARFLGVEAAYVTLGWRGIAREVFESPGTRFADWLDELAREDTLA